ncbi:very short patch repair endonuclease [Sulfurimonas sp. HSL3-7]|uniref:very short patch repair endonuclease n=1 Tax=Sulfonitrofixus jiaomeiensis TaxID=3131938 RepID=UPI0031F9A8F2
MNSKKKYSRDGRAPIPKNEQISKNMSAIKAKNTKPELLLRKALWHNGIRGYRLHWKKAPGRPDIAFPGKKIAIFINGCFWHRCPHCNPSMPKVHIEFWEDKFKKNVERDKKKLEQLEKDDWRTLVIWECQLKQDPMIFVAKIREMLDTSNK